MTLLPSIDRRHHTQFATIFSDPSDSFRERLALYRSDLSNRYVFSFVFLQPSRKRLRHFAGSSDDNAVFAILDPNAGLPILADKHA